MTSPAQHAIESFVLGAATFAMCVYFAVALFVMWADRPYTVGRDPVSGRARAVRPR